MRLPFVLAIALLAAGCTALNRGGGDEPLAPAATQGTTHATTTAPTPAATTSPSPSPSPPPPPPTAPTPGGDTKPPSKPADYHANKSGFVELKPRETFVAKLGFPVEAGAANVTASVNLTTETPAGLAPVQTSNLTIRFVDPDGRTLRNASSNLPVSQEARLVLTLGLASANLTRPGEYTLVVEVTGLSDGESLGQRFGATVDVKY